MISTDEDALFCDFAQFYHVIDFYTLEAGTAARLAAGLGANSRIKARRMGLNVPLDTFLRAEILDALHLILWTKTKDATKGRNKPKMTTEGMIIKEKQAASFDSVNEFEAARKRILGG